MSKKTKALKSFVPIFTWSPPEWNKNISHNSDAFQGSIQEQLIERNKKRNATCCPGGVKKKKSYFIAYLLTVWFWNFLYSIIPETGTAGSSRYESYPARDAYASTSRTDKAGYGARDPFGASMGARSARLEAPAPTARSSGYTRRWSKIQKPNET